MARHTRLFPLAALLLAWAAPLPLPAQQPHGPSPAHGEALLLGINVGIAAGSAALQARMRGGDPWRAALGGALGGGAVHAGQRMVGGGAPELRFLGLQTVALGANVAGNAGQGHPWLRKLTLPLYPFYVQLQDGRPAGVRVSAAAVAMAGYKIVGRGAEVDWRTSATAGALVLRTREPLLQRLHDHQHDEVEARVVASHAFGIVLYAADRPGDAVSHSVAHELSHVAQHSRDALLHAVPAGDALLAAAGPLAPLRRVLVLDVLLPLRALQHAGSRAFTDDPARDGLYEREVDAYLRLEPRPRLLRR
jgi:hypothetical protein